MALDRRGRLLASSCADGTVRFWHVETGQIFPILKGQATRVYMRVFAPDGSHLASGEAGRRLRIWKAAAS
ncbi:WD40 repeat domain-containing protein [Thermogemmatispora sp.]|uniref:WD40 repeat domain-containing protein n=1 Tax=Thermogemmatispora sp. TaxID=1968838 RepID=UPI001E09A884|nr:hypothetical protein [Thermogemmatispora sp.]MBX5449143.1 hypothetical protein [Thermogemmatispora sp.]